MSTQRDHLSDHEYDGIREYDNPTPGWWHVIFLATVVFSIIYFAFWEFSPMAWTPQDVLAARQQAEDRRLFARFGELKPDEATILMLMGDEKMMRVAQGTFVGNCAACHARDGGGITGDNLTDDAYKHVTSLADFYGVITNGANNNAMPGWKHNFTRNERILLAAYSASLRGTRPSTPKAAEGNPIAPWPALPVQASPVPAGGS